ncbi:hypothetical protein [Phaeodactylibacter sp.]|uniref:hypothetical protein n=1 Tax=Phaeodactylibacter sp. TaxID=1940289 RepID=UPI0025DCB48B|nr:hypothetical protein [Phaeodactylibacter sp.]MCI4650864.1 hypothetical protein [Phaeodactylibacter sp.]MCI5089821.1 hypothetical protein [Phaeodactylibacter sp.]
MKHYILSLLFLCLALSVQAQFRMASDNTPSWASVNDSTYIASVSFSADQTGFGYLANQIDTTFRLFTGTEQLYRVDSVWNAFFSSADLRVVEIGPTNGSPAGQVMVFDPDGRRTIPAVPFGSTGSTAQLQAAVVSWNAKNLSPSGLIQEGANNNEVIRWNSATERWEPEPVNSIEYLLESDTISVCNDGSCDYETLNQALEYASFYTSVYDSLDGNKFIIIDIENNQDGSKTILYDKVNLVGGNWGNVKITTGGDTLLVNHDNFSDRFFTAKACSPPPIFEIFNALTDPNASLPPGSGMLFIDCSGISSSSITLDSFDASGLFLSSCTGTISNYKTTYKGTPGFDTGLWIQSSSIYIAGTNVISGWGRGVVVKRNANVYLNGLSTPNYINRGVEVGGAHVVIANSDLRKDGATEAASDLMQDLVPVACMLFNTTAGTNFTKNVPGSHGIFYSNADPAPFQESTTAQEPAASSGIRYYWNTDCNCLKVTKDGLTWQDQDQSLASQLPKGPVTIDAQNNAWVIDTAGIIRFQDLNGSKVDYQFVLSPNTSIPLLINRYEAGDTMGIRMQAGETYLRNSTGEFSLSDIVTIYTGSLFENDADTLDAGVAFQHITKLESAELEGFTATDSTLTYTGTQSKRFLLQYNANVNFNAGSAGTWRVDIRPYVNAVNIDRANSTGLVETSGADDDLRMLSGSAVVTLNTNDVISLRNTATIGINYILDNLNLSLTEL